MSIDEIKNSIKKLKKDILVSYLGIAFFVLFLFLVILGISILFVNAPTVFKNVKITKEDTIFLEKFKRIYAPIIFIVYMFTLALDFISLKVANERLTKIQKMNLVNFLNKYKTVKLMLTLGIFVSLFRLVGFIMLFFELNNEIKKIMEMPSEDFIKSCNLEIDKEAEDSE